MEQKRYFDRFTLGMVMFFIIIIALVILGGFSKYFLVTTNKIFSDEKSRFVYENGQLLELLVQSIAMVIFLYSLYCFYRFMVNSNKGKLFSINSAKQWKRISTIYIIFGIGLLMAGFVDSKFFAGCLVTGFISSVAYSFSKIFIDASLIKEENDLTV